MAEDCDSPLSSPQLRWYQSPLFKRKWLRERFSSRSADNSPMVARRPLRIPLPYGAQKASTSSVGSVTEQPITVVAKKPRWNHASRRQKIWQSLKQRTQLTFRSRSKDNLMITSKHTTYNRNGQTNLIDPNLSSSQPNLVADDSGDEDFCSLEANSPFPNDTIMPKKFPLKGIIRNKSSAADAHQRSDSLQPQQRFPLQQQTSSSSRVGFSDRHSVDNTATAAGGNSILQSLNAARRMTDRTFKDQQHAQQNGAVADGGGEDKELSAPGAATAEHPTEPIPDPFITFLLTVNLKDGRDLVIRDASGSSDPYVKFKYKNKLMYRSNTIFKNLNPIWDETFSQLLEDPTTPLHIEVFDYDRFAMDDFMGSAEIDLSQFNLWQPFELRVMLADDKIDEYMGFLNIQITIVPQTESEKNQFMQKSVRTAESVRKPPAKVTQSWSSVVNVVLVEAKNLLPTECATASGTNTPLPDPYVKFKLGTEKYKSKIMSRTLEPKWCEIFDLHIFDEAQQTLQVMVYDKKTNLFMGRCSINLVEMERELTHQRWFELEDGAGSLLLLLSISGTSGSDTVTDITLVETGPEYRHDIEQKYALRRLNNIRDVGHLSVKVFRAQGVAAADIGGKSDPFCVLELVNTRLQTQTVYKTLNPEWNKLFTFNVKDIHSVLELTVYDEDPNKKVEFLGKVGIPLLKIRNGEKRWYALKDRKLNRRAKGQMLLELELHFNDIKAAIRTFNPREQKFIAHEQKFKRAVFMNNVQRIRQLAQTAIDVKDFIKSCFNWDSPARSIVAFTCFVTMTYFFDLYLLPMCLLLLFLKSYMYRSIVGGLGGRRASENEVYFESEDDDADADDKDGGNTSIKERLAAIQDALAMVQNALDFVASLMERVRNTFNFTQPWLSWLAILVLTLATILLYFVPLRWIIMIWGINKFTKKLRNPHFIDNNELLDYLSRVPCDKDIRIYGEFRPEPVVDPTATTTNTSTTNRTTVRRPAAGKQSSS